MSYADSLLAKDEVILYHGRQHWLAPLSDARNALLILLGGLVLLLVGTLVFSLAVASIFGLVAGVIILIALIWIGVIYFSWRAEEYLITTRRVIKVEGLLDKKAGDSSLDKINDAVLKQGILARLFKYGDLEILTANEQAIDRHQMLSHVVDFKKAMLNAKNELEDGSYHHGATAAAPVAAAAGRPAPKSSSADEVTGTLAKLADLRDKGAITPAEYEAKKAELLGRL